MRWGEADCATAAAEHVRRLTGRDVFAPWRGRYADARGAARLIAEAGGMVALVDAALSGLWTRGGEEIAALGPPARPVLAVREGPWWRMPGAGGSVLRVRRDAVAPLASWGPDHG